MPIAPSYTPEPNEEPSALSIAEQTEEYKRRRATTLVAVRNILSAPKTKTAATLQAAASR